MRLAFKRIVEEENLKFVRKMGRKLKSNLLKPKVEIDYIDAPIIRPKPAYIPVGRHIVYSHNYESTREKYEIEYVPLGKAVIDGDYGRVRQRGVWLMEFSWFGGHTFLSPSYQIHPPRDRKKSYRTCLSGVTMSSKTFYSNVYGHVLLDEMPMLLSLFEDNMYQNLDNILCSDLAMKLIERMELPHSDQFKNKLRVCDVNTEYFCEEYIAYRRTGCCKNPSVGELQLIRKYAQATYDEGSSTAERIFLKRSSSERSIVNWSEIESLLNHHRFEIVSGAALNNPWQYFGNARIVAGVSGSDLSDTCFMKQGSSLIEIIPSDHVQPYNWNVSRKLELNYHGILATSLKERGTPMGPGNSPMYVDPAALNELIKGL